MSFLDLIADSVDPALVIAAIVAAVLEWRENGRRDSLAFIIATVLSVAAIYVVMSLDRTFQLWQRYGSDYSTHTAFATALVVSMCIWRVRWRAAVAGVWLAYLVLTRVLGYHSVGDIVAAAVVAVIVTLPWHLAARGTRGWSRSA